MGSNGAGVGLRAGLLVALGAVWLVLFEPFVFPNNDYFSFERAARSFATGQWPDSFKRGPLLPGAMALTAPLVGGPHPELRAALIWNWLLSLGFVALLFRFAWRTAPQSAPWFALLLVTTPVLHALALQPLVEPSLAFFVALAFVGLRERAAWQYAAAAAAALSRPEAAVLAVVLAVANGAAEGRWVRHATLAALALVPFAAWNALGARAGSGAAVYGDLMQAFSPHGFALVAVHYLREGLGGWSLAPGAAGLVLGAVLGGVIGGLGVARTLRESPRETWAALGWFAASALAIAVFGISKSRYVLPTVWIPLWFVAAGATAWGVRIGPPRGRWVAACLLVPLAVGGVLRAHTLLGQVREFDREVLAAAEWLGAELRDGDRVAIVHTSQVLWATDLEPRQVVAYASLAATDLASLRTEMAARGIDYAAWTWRRPATNEGQAFYDARKKVGLAEAFREGGPVEGFELVATLPTPGRPEQAPARIYRLRR